MSGISPDSRGPPHVQALLDRTSSGDRAAAEDLFARIYDELRALALETMGRGGRRGRPDRGPDDTLQPTALVHEVYLKLVGSSSLDYRSRTHFRAIAARAMRQVLCDSARARGRDRRGGNWARVTLSGIGGGPVVTPGELADSLERFARHDERAAKVVVLRYFGGLTDEEIATHLDVSARTVRSDWRMARAWLRSRLA